MPDWLKRRCWDQIMRNGPGRISRNHVHFGGTRRICAAGTSPNRGPRSWGELCGIRPTGSPALRERPLEKGRSHHYRRCILSQVLAIGATPINFSTGIAPISDYRP
jgi:hypothetical protein